MSIQLKHPVSITVRVGLAAFVTACALLALAATARQAHAHATLTSSVPAADEVVSDLPGEVVLTFDEAVEAGLGGVEIFAPDGTNVAGNPRSAAAGREIVVPVDAESEGTYTVAWQVVSSDSHTIDGSFVFSVGQVGRPFETQGRAAGPFGAGVVRVGAQSLVFAGVILVIGVIAVLLFVDPTGVMPWSRLRLLLIGGAAAIMVASFVLWVAQVAEASGKPLHVSVGLVAESLDAARFARLALIRLVLATTVAVTAFTFRHRPRRTSVLVLAALALGVTATVSTGGHAWSAPERVLAVSTDLIHLLAAGIWIGGLCVVVLVARSVPEWMMLLRRFSRVALVTAGIVVFTGVASYLIQAGEPGLDVLGARYGRLVAVKVTLVFAILVVAWWLRARLLRREVVRQGAVWRAATVEVLLAVAVVAITGALVHTAPPRGPDIRRVQVEESIDGGTLRVVVDPGTVGTNTIRFEFRASDGRPLRFDAVEVALAAASVPSRNVPLTMVGPGRALAESVLFGRPGEWTLEVTWAVEGRFSTREMEVSIR